MYERLLFTVAMVVFSGAVLMFMKRRQIYLANRASQQSNEQTNMPTIVYFWSDGCSVCKGRQRPILERILDEYGKEQIAITSYNVDEAMDIAEKWGVRTLPTTFLLDSAGTIRHVNNSLVVSEDLRKQLEPIIFEYTHSK